MNIASVSVKDLKKAIVRARNSIGCDQLNKNLRISCNGSAQIKFNGSQFSGEIAIPCNHFGDDFDFLATVDGIDNFLSSLQGWQHSVTLNENGVIACDQFNQSLSPILNADGSIRGNDLQVFNRCAPTDEMTINARDFAAALKFVLPAIDDDNRRYILDCVQFTWSTDSLELISTDGRRLHRHHVSWSIAEGTGKGQVLIPASALQEFLKIAPKSGNVTLKCDAFEYCLKCAAGSFYGRRPEGRFPRVQDIIPVANSTFEVSRGQAVDNLKKLLGEYRDDRRGVTLYYATENGIVRAHLGDKTVELGVKVRYHFQKLTVDLKYLLEALNGFGPGPVEFSIPTEGTTPLRIDSGRSMALIMPMSE